MSKIPQSRWKCPACGASGWWTPSTHVGEPPRDDHDRPQGGRCRKVDSTLPDPTPAQRAAMAGPFASRAYTVTARVHTLRGATLDLPAFEVRGIVPIDAARKARMVVLLGRAEHTSATITMTDGEGRAWELIGEEAHGPPALACDRHGNFAGLLTVRAL